MQVVPADIAAHYKMLAPNCVAGVENAIYHAEGGLSSTNLKDILVSPSTYHQREQVPIKQSDPMLGGEVVHCLSFQPHLYELLYKVSPTKGKTTKAWISCAEEWPNHTIISPGMADNAFRMRDALYANPAIHDIFEQNKEWREVSIWVQHPETKLVCKIRPDMIGDDGIIYDLKTTISPTKEAFRHSVLRWRYDLSSTFYYDMARLVGLNPPSFKFIVVGSNAPHLTAIYDLGFDFNSKGRGDYLTALRAYRNFLTGDGWDGLSYGRETTTLTLGFDDRESE